MAGIPADKIVEAHGTFVTATCQRCRQKYECEEIRQQIFDDQIPKCTKTPRCTGVIKPDIVFFGEQLPDDFHHTISIDKDKCDLLIIMGSSLKVKPVSLVSELLPSDIPQILINRERLPHKSFDIELLGNCDVIINELCARLAKSEPSFGQIKQLKNRNIQFMNEILYEKLRASMQQQQHKRKRH